MTLNELIEAAVQHGFERQQAGAASIALLRAALKVQGTSSLRRMRGRLIRDVGQALGLPPWIWFFAWCAFGPWGQTIRLVLFLVDWLIDRHEPRE